MIFRQLFDSESFTYTYLIASRWGGEAVIIDPVLERVDQYLRLLQELGLILVKAIDTHLHADHKSGLGVLRDRTKCITVMGEQNRVWTANAKDRLFQPESDFVSSMGLSKLLSILF